MTIRNLIDQLERIEEKYREVDVVVECPNGLLVAPSIKNKLKDKYDVFNHSPENTEYIVLAYE